MLIIQKVYFLFYFDFKATVQWEKVHVRLDVSLVIKILVNPSHTLTNFNHTALENVDVTTYILHPLHWHILVIWISLQIVSFLEHLIITAGQKKNSKQNMYIQFRYVVRIGFFPGLFSALMIFFAIGKCRPFLLECSRQVVGSRGSLAFKHCRQKFKAKCEMRSWLGKFFFCCSYPK